MGRAGERNGADVEGTGAAEYQHLEHGFEPVFDARSRVLVLGSFPSELSRENQFYYGNPRNRFWGVVAMCLGVDVPRLDDIAGKKAMLLEHGIALWDVVQSCDIKGSSDASIRNVVPARIERVLSVARIETIAVNGRTAETLYNRYLRDTTGIEAVCLPSTSPANASWTFGRLVSAWCEVLDECC